MAKTKTTVRDYDVEGNLVRETITEQDYDAPLVAAWGSDVCYCGWTDCGWSARCPAHGYRPKIYTTTTTFHTNTGNILPSS